MIPGPATVSLSVEEVAVTEAWLNLHMENIKQDYRATVWRDSVQIYHNAAGEDTLIYDSGLLPAHSYTYQVSLFRDETVVHQSEPVMFTTMDTTSHEFQWEVFEFPSPYGSGVLRDVTIINENDIWAVGEIYADSAQPSKRYNAVHWNGQQWELKRIPYVYNGQPFYHPMNFAFSFQNGEVWFGGNGIVKWAENSFSNIEITQNAWGPVAINKIWGISPENVFIVGNEGSIAYYNGSSWQQLGSRLWPDFHDIQGFINLQTGKTEFLAVSSAAFQIPEEKIVLYYDGTRFHEISNEGLPGTIVSLWFKPGKKYYIVGDGVFYTRQPGTFWQADTSHPLIFKSAIRGNDINDIIITGGFGLVSHFNGVSWHHYAGSGLPTFYGNYGAVDLKGNLLVTVGWIGEDAIILRGYRH